MTVRNVFKDGPSVWMEASQAIQDLEEALDPPACEECGHKPSALNDYQELVRLWREALQRVSALPMEQARDIQLRNTYKNKLRKLASMHGLPLAALVGD